MMTAIQQFPQPTSLDAASGPPEDRAGSSESEPEVIYAIHFPLPREILLGSVMDRRLRVTDAMRVLLSTEDTADGTKVIAEAPEINEFGFGENISEAIGDLQRAIVQLFFELEEQKERLSEDLRSVLEVLRRKLRRYDDQGQRV